jgi:hypothetical protein
MMPYMFEPEQEEGALEEEDISGGVMQLPS